MIERVSITLDLPVPVAPRTAMRGSILVLRPSQMYRRAESIPCSASCPRVSLEKEKEEEERIAGVIVIAVVHRGIAHYLIHTTPRYLVTTSRLRIVNPFLADISFFFSRR